MSKFFAGIILIGLTNIPVLYDAHLLFEKGSQLHGTAICIISVLCHTESTTQIVIFKQFNSTMSMDIDAPVVLPSRPLIPQASATYILALPPEEPRADSLLEFFAATAVHP